MKDINDYIGKIHHADCLDLMKEFPDTSIDLILTSPPFLDEDIEGDYYEFLDKFIVESARVSKVLCMFNSSKRINDICIKYRPEKILIWDKVRSMSACRYEPIFCWSFSNFNLNTLHRDCIAFMPIFGKLQIVPYQNPVELYMAIIKMFKGFDIICDAFSGSGTTASACYKLRKKFICIEKEEKYVELSRKRLQEEQSQMRMEI